MSDELTIIVPIFNEEECLPAFLIEMDRFIEASPMPSQVLFINDGSTDNSLTILKEYCNQTDCYNVLSLDKNYGLSVAVKVGIDHCRTALLGYIDADLQTHPVDFLTYFKYFPEYDMVNGIREKRQDKFVKRLSSKIGNGYRRLMVNDAIRDTCCPLKILKLSYAREMPFFKGMHRFIPALVQLQGGKVRQIPISHSLRYAGASKYHLFNRLVGPFFDTLAFRWMRSRYIRYKIVD
jgi:glycosyltransferase involved in cell wall biosynthesis